MNYINSENLRLTLGSEKLLNPEIEKKILIRASQKYSLSHNSTQESCVIKKFAAITRPGKDKTGKTKINQDSMISRININNIKDFNIFGVLDGHGPSGHYISKFAAQFIQNYIVNNPEIKNLTKLESIYLKLKENNYQIIKQSFTLIDRQLESQSFESLGSGTTCILVVQVGRNVICANVGDSRAVAVFDEDTDNNLSQLNVTPLSIDYKLEIPEERNRIIMAGGAVEQAKNSLGIRMGPLRIFTPGKDYPGLAMSRSIGDLEGKKYGIIAEPGIIEFNVNESTKYIVLCSDGVWEFLSNEQVKEIGRGFYLNNNPNGYVEELLKLSVKEWEDNDNTIDDITAIVLFF
jgi:serine/threonine protein phosphatase PrpC